MTAALPLDHAEPPRGDCSRPLPGFHPLRVAPSVISFLTVIAIVASGLLPPALARASAAAHLEGKTASSVRIFLVAIGDNGKSGKRIGCGDSLIAVTKRIPPTTAPLTAAIRLLLAGHHRYYGQSGLYNALYQSRLTLTRATVTNGKATIRLTGSLHLGGECDNPRVSAQLKQTAFQFPTVHGVWIYVNGRSLQSVLSLK